MSETGAEGFLSFHSSISGLSLGRTTTIRSAEGGISQTIVLENRSSEPIEAASVYLALYPRPVSQECTALTLATYLYGFSFLIDKPTDQQGLRLVSYTRHSALTLWLQETAIQPDLVYDANGENHEIRLVVPRLDPGQQATIQIDAAVMPTSGPAMRDAQLDGIMFQTVSAPLRGLCVLVEAFVRFVDEYTGSLGFAMILLVVLFRVATLPLNRWALSKQAMFSDAQKRSAWHRRCRQHKDLSGIARSERVLEVYKEHNTTPLSGLKSSFPLLIQIPVLLAIFAITTESDPFRASEFLWISDLSMQDALVETSYHVPVFGSNINLLLILFGCIGLASFLLLPEDGRSGFWLSILFTLLFYPLASALVIYWITVNFVQLLERLFFRKLTQST